MKSLFNLLNTKKNESAIMRGAHAALTVEEADKIFEELFGADTAKYIKAVYYRNGVLGVRCQGSSASMEIKMNEDQILAKIKEKFDGININKIKILL
jgi:thiamine phosphate synthase YjbQ (UPF0047 family)